MEKEYWLNKWQINDIGFHEQAVSPDLVTYVSQLKLQVGDSILVPLCGKSKDMLWLADQGFQIIGVELSSIACQDFFSSLAISPQITPLTTFTRLQHDNITLLCGDIFNLTSKDLPKTKAIYDCKALIALPSDIRKKYVDKLIECAGKNIHILLLTRETTCPVKPPPFPIRQAEVESLYGDCFQVQLLKQEQVDPIPARLVAKGYQELIESVYVMNPLA